MNEDDNSNEENLDWFYGGASRAKQSVESICHSNENMMRKVKMSLFEESLGCFNIYYRQRDALLKREEEGEQSRIFSYEYSGSKEGRRRFLLTTIERFWRWYEQCENVSFYELIPDGCPARLYFDLEFYRGTNQNVDQTQLVNDFSDCVKETLNEVFQIEFDSDKMTVVLDASTQTKFSEHLILHLPGECLFPSNVSMKKSFIDVLEKKMFSTNRGIVWNKDASKTTTLFDAGVYTTNRNFRLYLSTKIGKNNPLVLSDRCHFYANPSAISKKRIFLDSLIVPARYSQSPKVLQTISETTQYPGIVSQPPVVLHIPVSESSNATNNYIDYMSGYGLTSPYPMLEDYIVTINRRWRDGVSIRMWKLSKHINDGSLRINYYLSGCRYCYNVGREHRRNHVYWTVDLVRMHCFQKCFDIDCRGTQSNYFPLPPLIRQSISPSTQGETSSASNVDDTFPTVTISCRVRSPGSIDERTDESCSKTVQEIAENKHVEGIAIEKNAPETDLFDSFYDERFDDEFLGS